MTEDYKTTVVVLHTMPHGEKGVILYAYSRDFGRIAYYLFSSKGGVVRVGGNKISLQPLSVLSLVGRRSSRGDLHRMVEAHSSFITVGIHGNIIKSSIAMYMCEFLYRVVKEQQGEPMVFDFIIGCIKSLDVISDKEAANFHLYFTMQMVRFLGFYPDNNYFDGSFFDIILGKFVLVRPLHQLHLETHTSELLSRLMTLDIDSLGSLSLSRVQRVELLDAMIKFLGYHHETAYRIESLKILGELF